MRLKNDIIKNAKTIQTLHNRVHDTYINKSKSYECCKEWEDACAEFNTKYDQLAFIGGTINARDRIRGGDPIAIEYALDFIEIRPYFYRSGYMFEDFMRVLKNCQLSHEQRLRYNIIKNRYDIYRRQRQGRDSSVKL